MHAIFLYPLYAGLLYVSVMLGCLTAHKTIPQAPNILGFIARSMLAYLALMICAAYGTFASFVLGLLNLHYQYGQWTTAKSFQIIGSAMTGVRFEVQGDGRHILDSNRPVVIVGNHQTELDILMLAAIWPKGTSVTAKKQLKNIPFLGWFMSLSGTVFIDRVDRTQAMKAFEGAAKTMKELKQNVYIFPEGTRSYSAEPVLLPFKKGAFHLAVQAQVDILPVVAENYSGVLNIKAKRFNPGVVRIKVLPPISTKGLTTADVTQLTENTRDKMLAVLTEMAQDSQTRSARPIEAKKVA